MADILYLVKFYATAFVIFMTVDCIKGIYSPVSLNWFLNGGCAVILILICVAVSYGELKGLSFEEIDG